MTPAGKLDAAKAFILATHYKAAPIDPTWGYCLYGHPADEMVGKACCDWGTFISGFLNQWHAKFDGTDPHPRIVKHARSHWRRYSMTPYEALVTIEQELEAGTL